MNEELRNFIEWQAAQSQGWGLPTFADGWAKAGIDPYTSAFVLKMAAETIDRANQRIKLFLENKITIDVAVEKPWTADWRKAMADAAAAEAARDATLFDGDTVVGPA